MTAQNNKQYAHPILIGFIILLSYGLLAVIILWRFFQRIITVYKPDNISFRNGHFVLQPDNQKMTLLELYTLNDFVYHFFIPIAVVSLFALILKWDFKEFFGIQYLKNKKSWVYFFGGLILIIIINLLLPPPGDQARGLFDQLADGASLFHLIIIIGILIPVIEEIIFRRLFYDMINFTVKKATPWAGIIGSAIIFGLLHYQYQAAAMIGTLAVSLILSVGRYYTKGIVIPILIHIVINTIGCILML